LIETTYYNIVELQTALSDATRWNRAQDDVMMLKKEAKFEM